MGLAAIAGLTCSRGGTANLGEVVSWRSLKDKNVGLDASSILHKSNSVEGCARHHHHPFMLLRPSTNPTKRTERTESTARNARTEEH